MADFELIKVNVFPEQEFVVEGASWFVIAGEDGIAHKINDIRLRQFLLGAGTGARVIEPGTLVINSSISATLTGAQWVHDGGVYSFTGDLTLPGSPAEPDNRFDIVTFGNSATPVVKSGTAQAEPAVPNPDSGFLLGHIIYRPYGGGGVVIPVNPNTYSTSAAIGNYGLYAPIWKQTTQANTHYSFKLSFLSWVSEYGEDGQYPTNGFVLVNFVTNGGNASIDPNRVAVRTLDMGVDNGDFVLVQTTASEATLFAKKKGFFGTLSFMWVDPIGTNVLPTSLINGGSYASLPGGTAYQSYNGKDYVSSTMPVGFDLPRQYGFETPVTGNITFPAEIGDANPPNPNRVDTNVMVKILHNSAGEPTVVAPQNVWVRCEGGTYVTNENNIFYMIAHKNSSNRVVGISYTITQPQWAPGVGTPEPLVLDGIYMNTVYYPNWPVTGFGNASPTFVETQSTFSLNAYPAGSSSGYESEIQVDITVTNNSTPDPSVFNSGADKTIFSVPNWNTATTPPRIAMFNPATMLSAMNAEPRPLNPVDGRYINLRGRLTRQSDGAVSDWVYWTQQMAYV